jgi:hypothetical protein
MGVVNLEQTLDKKYPIRNPYSLNLLAQRAGYNSRYKEGDGISIRDWCRIWYDAKRILKSNLGCFESWNNLIYRGIVDAQRIYPEMAIRLANRLKVRMDVKDSMLEFYKKYAEAGMVPTVKEFVDGWLVKNTKFFGKEYDRKLLKKYMDLGLNREVAYERLEDVKYKFAHRHLSQLRKLHPELVFSRNRREISDSQSKLIAGLTI